ncbi:MAG: MoaD/ThiS family protein [Promethearchaeota archaeon]
MEKSVIQNSISEGQYREIKVTEKKTVRDLLKELKLENAYLAVLVDGEKAELDDEIVEGQKIIILPKIAGG